MGVGDVVISPTSIGPAPFLTDGEASSPAIPAATGDPAQAIVSDFTGDPVFNMPASLLHAPAVTLPLMAVRGMPVGVQVFGQRHTDYRVVDVARWMTQNLTPVVTG